MHKHAGLRGGPSGSAAFGVQPSGSNASHIRHGRTITDALKLTLPLSATACHHRAAVQFNTVYQSPVTTGAFGLRWGGY
jgi:hypothetical protein